MLALLVLLAGIDAKEFVITTHAFAQARRITLYEISNPFDPGYDKLKANPKVAGYPILRQHTVSRKESGPLVTALTSRSNYFPEGEGWTCLFEPHHVLELAGDSKTVRLVICIKCGDVDFLDGEKELTMRSVTAAGDNVITRQLQRLTNH